MINETTVNILAEFLMLFAENVPPNLKEFAINPMNSLSWQYFVTQKYIFLANSLASMNSLWFNEMRKTNG